jgi:Ca2+:H+ antiporter
MCQVALSRRRADAAFDHPLASAGMKPLVGSNGTLTRGDLLFFGAGIVMTAASAVTAHVDVGPVAPFVVSAVALGVLAGVVGRSVDHLSDRLKPGSTGLVQAALGNLPELFFGIFALRAGLVGVVQSALVGSILANVLLILGAAFVVGGLRHGTQQFAAANARSVALLLLLAVAILSVPGISAHLHVAVSTHETALSTAAAVVLLIIFVLSIPAAVKDNLPSPTTEIDGPTWSLGLVLAVLGASSVAAAFVSDWFVAALTPALSVLHMSQAFAGLVVVAIAGNAVENVVGVQLAAKNKSDYAVEVVLRSPVMIAFALMPALVLLSPLLGGARLTLVLPPELLAVLVSSAVITAVVVFDGESTWLEGCCLLGLYVVVAASFWWG